MRDRYDEIRERIDTFTIINCEHRNWFWRLIGHTAVVYKDPQIGQLMVLESTQMGKSGISGVQLSPMGKWVNEYPGTVKIRILQRPHGYWVGNVRGQQQQAAFFIKKYLGTSYPDVKSWEGKKKLILSALDLEIDGKDILTYTGDDQGIFCTMLVIMFYQYCGLMESWLLDKEFEPDDTRESGIAEKLLIDCVWSDEIEIY